MVLLVICVVSFLIFQPAPVLETFTAGGVENLLRYHPATAATAAAARESITHSVEVYMPLWDHHVSAMPFQTIIDVLDEEDPLAQAEAEIEPLSRIDGDTGTFAPDGDEVCYVIVYNRSIERPDDIVFILAHELTHCFQDYYIPAAFNDTPLAKGGWWAEGVAEWMASIAYPEWAGESLGFGVAQEEMVYLARHNVSLTDSRSRPGFYEGYGAAYFWQYLAMHRSVEGVLGSLRDIPAPVDDEESYQDYVFRELAVTENTLIDFALTLARQELDFQPAPSELYGPVRHADLPFTVDVNMKDYTVKFVALQINAAAGVDAVRISTEGLSGHIVAKVNTSGEEFATLDDDHPVTLCLPAEGVTARLVFARGDGDGDAPFLLRATGVTGSDCDSPTPDDLVSPDCVVGEWQLTSDPMSYFAVNQGMMSFSDPGLTLVVFGEDGQMSYAMNDFVMLLANPGTASGGTLTLNTLMNGTVGITPNGDGTFKVTAFHLEFSELSVMANINGFEMDMTDTVRSMMDASIVPTPATISCSGDSLTWVIPFEGNEYTWRFVRYQN